jgi:hypothetical protein
MSEHTNAFWERYVKALDEGRGVYEELKVLEQLPTWSEKKSFLGKHQYNYSMMTPSSMSSYLNDLIDYMRTLQLIELRALRNGMERDLNDAELFMKNAKYADVPAYHAAALKRIDNLTEELLEKTGQTESEVVAQL